MQRLNIRKQSCVLLVALVMTAVTNNDSDDVITRATSIPGDLDVASESHPLMLSELWKASDLDLESRNMSLFVEHAGRMFKHSCGSKVYTLNMVLSAPKNIQKRNLIRRTYGSNNKGRKKHCTLFSVGYTQDDSMNLRVLEESLKHKDLFFVPVSEFYRNLANKVITSYGILAKLSGDYKFIMKSDDDVFVVSRNLMRYLMGRGSNENFVGFVKRNDKPIRDKEDKNHMTEEDFPQSVIHPYARGYGYALNKRILTRLLKRHTVTRRVSNEDVYISLLAYNEGIKITHNQEFYLFGKDTKPNRKSIFIDISKASNEQKARYILMFM